jgi:hypothetical protein
MKTFVTAQGVPLIAFEGGNAKMMCRRLSRPSADDGVVVIDVAQGRCARSSHRNGRAVTFGFSRQSVALNHYYFYVPELQGTCPDCRAQRPATR